MKKSIKIKLLSLMVTLLVAFGAMFSVATITKAKADGSDVTVTVGERYLNAGEEFSFCVNAYSKAGFSSYQLNIDVPDFVKVTGIVSRMGGEDAEFVYAKNGSNTYRITFSSDYNETGEKTMFEVYASVDEDAQGRCGACTIYDAKFTNTSVAYLSVETNCAMFYVNGGVSVVKGDFNGDGIVDLKDVMLMQRAIAYGIGLTDTQSYAGDIDNNGIIDIYDCQYIRSYLIGVIPSLDNIGGNDQPHGGEDENICGEYICHHEEGGVINYTTTLNLYENKTFTEDFSDDLSHYEGTYFNIGNKVYLVDGYTLEIVYVHVGEGSFESDDYIDFTEFSTATRYAGTYLINGLEYDTVTVTENGAFLRTCFEDGYQMQYNGMISIEKFDEETGVALGVAYVFGTCEEDCLMAMPFTLDMNSHVLYVEGNNDEDHYTISFYVNGEKVGAYNVEAGSPYKAVLNEFRRDKEEMLINKYGAINFYNYSNDTGKNIYDGSYVDCDDNIYFYISQPQETWTENEKIYSVYWGDNSNKLYYGATRQDVLDLFVGKTFGVYKVYVSDKYQNSSKGEWFKDVVITEDMVGDTSNIDFSVNGSSYVEITLTIDGRTATMGVWLEPDMTGARLIKTGVSESTYYVNGVPSIDYYVLRFYNNEFIASYYINSDGVINTEPNSYMHYVTEDYNGTTLYLVNNVYGVFSGTVTIGDTEYQKFGGYQHAEGQVTVDYTLIIQGMGTTVFKVFNDEFAEMWSTSYYSDGLEYQGTVKVVIENDEFTYMNVTYDVGEGNMLFIPLPEGEPILRAVISGADVLFYEDGTAYVTFGGQVMMTMEWESNEDLTVISCNMMGEEMCFYKWELDNQYHSSVEPVWEDASKIYNLNYRANGETINYTLYIFQNRGSYLFDGETIISADAYYQNNIFDVRDSMTGESTYYYYNERGEMYDAVRYHIELPAEQYIGDDPDKNHFGYMYAVPAKGILVGYWQVNYGGTINSEDFRFTVNGDGNYVVNYNDKWLFTATPVGKENVHTDNKLVLVNFDGSERYYQSHGGNNGESGNGGSGESGEEGYELNAYNVFNGSVMGDSAIELKVNSYEELVNKIIQTLSEQPDAPTFLGLFYDANGEMPVTEENFHSGDIYMIFVQNDESGNGNNGGSGEVTVEITTYAVSNGEVMGSNDPVTFNSYEEFADSIGLPSETISGVYYDTYGREEVTARNFHSGNVYIFYIAG